MRCAARVPADRLRRRGVEKIHRAEKLELFAMDRALLAELIPHLTRRTKFDLSVSEGALYIDIDGKHLTGAVERLSLNSE